MVMPAKPELTRSWPQERSAKGRALEKMPMPRQWSQIRRPLAVARGGRPWPVASAMAVRMAAAMAMREAAIVSGPKPVRALAMPRKEPPQVSPRRKSRSQASGEAAGRAAGRDMRLSCAGIAAAEPEPSNYPSWQVGGNRLSGRAGATPMKGERGGLSDLALDHGAGR